MDPQAPPEGEPSSLLASVAEQATRFQRRSQLFPRASEQLAGSWGARAEEGSRAAPRGWCCLSPPRVPANISVPVAVARLEEAPHPLLLAGAGRVAAAAATAAAAAAAATGAPRRGGRHHAPVPCSGGGGRAAAGGIRAPQKLLAAADLPDDGACPVAAGALRARDSTSPGFPGLGRWAHCNRTLAEGEEGKVAPGVGEPRLATGTRGNARERCQLHASGLHAGPDS